ncbi:MAG TPA: hypothetical protein VGY98_12275, partial [Verrucomicrobiae bacterium]|nr:hypothetical protein [Verrucomicrobiae bacterium]
MREYASEGRFSGTTHPARGRPGVQRLGLSGVVDGNGHGYSSDARIFSSVRARSTGRFGTFWNTLNP